MTVEADPYAVLGVGRDASAADIHAAYRAAVRRTHPDVGGSAAAFEAVQDAYETLRDRPTRPLRPSQGRSAPSAGQSAPAAGAASSRTESLRAESRRLEDEARRLAGLPPRHVDPPASGEPGEESGDTVAAILRDAGDQLRQAADAGARELRRRVRRLL